MERKAKKKEQYKHDTKRVGIEGTAEGARRRFGGLILPVGIAGFGRASLQEKRGENHVNGHRRNSLSQFSNVAEANSPLVR